MPDIQIKFKMDKTDSTKGIVAVFKPDEDAPIHCDRLDIASDAKRRQFAKEVHASFEALPVEEVERVLREEVGRILARRQIPTDESAEGQQANAPGDTSSEVTDAALDLLRSPELFEQVLVDTESIGVAGEDDLKLTLYVIMTSRLMAKPLSAIVQGASASGKSYTIETVAKLMPPEAVVQAHDFTDQALYYLPVGSLKHKVVVSGERLHEHRGKDGRAEDNTKAFREMVGSGILRKAVTVKGSDGKPATELIEQPGPIAYLESSTAAQIHDEDSTRLLPLVTDESPEQTRKIIDAQRREAKGQIVADREKQEIFMRHHAMQRLLKPLMVRIPYIDSISLPENHVATRRTYSQLRYAIASVAFLRQYQKETRHDPATDGEYIDADEVDYEVAYRLMSSVLARKYSPLNHQSRTVLDIILAHTMPSSSSADHAEFTQADCEGWTGLSNPTVRRRLGPLVAAGILTVDDSGKPYRYTVKNADLAKTIDLSLPSPEEIGERMAVMAAQS